MVTGVGSKVAGVSWLVAGGFAAWAAARVAGADRVRQTETVLVPLMSFTPQVAAAAPLAALGVPRRQPEAVGPTLRVLTINLLVGRADPEAVVARVRQADLDVLFVQELTIDAQTRLKQAGLEDLLPHAQVEHKDGGPRGSGIYSRFPLTEGTPLPLTFACQPAAVLELPDGQQVDLVCVHPRAPAMERGGSVQWRSELGVLPAPGKLPRLVAGDFNATPDHAAFRDILRRGYVDAAIQTGESLTRTWGRPRREPLLTLDHVLASRGCAVLACSVHAIPGSDHRAVYAEIRLPAAGQ
jgi:endonuclease/exonuclease/phosphatase (EEP) superfamily protein YafD